MDNACVFVTPSALACPSPAQWGHQYTDVLTAYINNLVHLRDNLASALIGIAVSRDVPSILIEAGCYPLYPSLKDGLAVADLDETYQLSDIVRVVDSVFRCAATIEELVGIDDLLADSIVLEGCSVQLGGPALVERQISHFLILALGKSIHRVPQRHTWVLGQKKVERSNETGGDPSFVHVSGTVHDIDWIDGESVTKLPIVVAEHLPYENSLLSVIHAIDLPKLCSTFPFGCVQELITLALCQASVTCGLLPRSEWLIGPEFEGSIRRLNLHRDEGVFGALLQTCVAIICNAALHKTHPLRTGNGGDDPQIERSSSSAWRRDINYEFHLHYWKRGNRCEFASCVVHNEFTIPDPS